MFGQFSEEQDSLRDSVRRFLAEKSAEPEVRRLMATPEGFDPAVWAQLADQLGLPALVIPEQYGGAGYSWIELGIVLEEMGRVLLCSPYFSTVVLAATALLESGDEPAKSKHLPGIASGATTATVAFTEPSGRWDEDGITLAATAEPHGYTLTGRKAYVLDGHTASLIIVAARTAAGVSLFLVDGDAHGLRRAVNETMDQTRKLATLDFAATPATLLGADGAGWSILTRMLDLAAVGLATEQVGGAQAALEMAVEYAKVRIQFGQPIGSFQAIKHKAADVLLEVESARSAAYYALWAAAEHAVDLPVAASLAKAYCSDAFVLAAHENIQIHGGIGFTWEVGAQLYFKRAKSMEVFLGDANYHRAQLVDRILV